MAVIIAPASPAPEIMETYGVPDFFADLAFVQPHGEIVRVVFVTEPTPNARQVIPAVRIFMPLGGFLRSKAHERAAELKAVLNSVQ